MKKEDNKMPQTLSLRTELMDTEVEEAIGKQLKNEMLRMFEEIKEGTYRQYVRCLTNSQRIQLSRQRILPIKCLLSLKEKHIINKLS